MKEIWKAVDGSSRLFRILTCLLLATKERTGVSQRFVEVGLHACRCFSGYKGKYARQSILFSSVFCIPSDILVATIKCQP